MQAGRPLDVHFVENRVGQRNGGRTIIAPVKAFVVDHGPQPVHRRRHHVVGESPPDFTCVGVKQQAARVEAVFRPLRPIHPVGVVQTGSSARQITVPDLIGTAGQRQGMQTFAVEQAQFDAFGMGREQGEIDALFIGLRPQRPGAPGIQPGFRPQGFHSR